MKIGFLFPGQGAQSVGMGKDLYDKYEVVRNTYEKVKNITGIDVAHITFEENEEVLNQTKYTQLCILTMSLSILNLLKENDINAEISTGLSLGEYTSLIYSGKIEFEDGIKLVKKRGEYMQALVPAGDWKMAAILGLDDDKVEDACNQVKDGFVKAVNFNCPGQVVVSGDANGIENVEKIAKELGAKKVRVLNTSGPFHTEKLLEASAALKKDLEKVEFKKFNCKVIRNIDGNVYSDSDDMVDILSNHIISSVRFSKGLEKMIDEGVDTFVEVGPGKTLSGFVKKLPSDNNLNILNINNIETFENTVNFLKKENN